MIWTSTSTKTLKYLHSGEVYVEAKINLGAFSHAIYYLNFQNFIWYYIV